MLDEERLSRAQKILHKTRCRYMDGTYSTVGHVYSVIVEVLRISNPDINGFIEELNDLLEDGGCGYARITSPLNKFYYQTYNRLQWYLSGLIMAGKATEDQKNAICKAAYEGQY